MTDSSASDVLAAPVVLEATDGALDPADLGTGVTIQIPGSSAIVAGDTINVFWGGQEVSSRSITDVIDVSDLNIEIPWSTIQAAGDGAAIPVYYTIADRAGNQSPVSKPIQVTVAE